MKKNWSCLGVAGTVGELIDILKKMEPETQISAAGGDCHVLFNGNKQVVFDEKDYSEEWNEEE